MLIGAAGSSYTFAQDGGYLGSGGGRSGWLGSGNRSVMGSGGRQIVGSGAFTDSSVMRTGALQFGGFHGSGTLQSNSGGMIGSGTATSDGGGGTIGSGTLRDERGGVIGSGTRTGLIGPSGGRTAEESSFLSAILRFFGF